MPKRAGIILVSTGVMLILSALLLFLYNGYEDAKAGKESQTLLADIQTLIPEKESEVEETERSTDKAESETETESESEVETESGIYAGVKELPVAEVDGYGYIGYLSIPELELELPVMSQWDYSRLRIAPCRHFGTTNEDMVIAAHNYKTHFKYLDQLQNGSPVRFTDMDGDVTAYEVAYVSTLDPHAVDEVQYSGYELVLYTCTLGGGTRIVAFCDRVTE